MKKYNPTKQPKAAKTSPPIAPVNTEYDIQNSNNSTNSLSISTLELVAVAPAPRVQDGEVVAGTVDNGGNLEADVFRVVILGD